MTNKTNKPSAYLEKRLSMYKITESDNKTLSYFPVRKKKLPSGVGIHDFEAYTYKVDKEIKTFDHNAEGDIVINYRDIDGRITTDPNLPKKHNTFTRTCFSPEKRKMLKEGPKPSSQKYGQKPGTGVHVFNTNSIIESFHKKQEIQNLILVEGEFKAFLLDKHLQEYLSKSKNKTIKCTVMGLPSMIAHHKNKYEKQAVKRIHSQIVNYIEHCKVQNILLLHDADARLMGSWDKKVNKDKDIGLRLSNFCNAVLTLKALVAEFPSTHLFYGHIDEIFCEIPVDELCTADHNVFAKGIDDLFIQENPNQIIGDLLRLSRANKYFNIINTHTKKDSEIRKMFYLNYDKKRLPSDFAERFKDEIKEHEFKFLGNTYEFRYVQEIRGKALFLKAHRDCTKFMRAGVKYVKILFKPNSLGQHERVLEPWTEAALKADYVTAGFPHFIKSIPKYDGFTSVPDHNKETFEQFIETERGDRFFNLYHPLHHDPKPGKWKVIKNYLEHIFRDKYDVALDYLYLLYNKPTQKLPIIALVSKEKSTGKSTFIWLLKAIFSENATVIGNQELHDNFNDDYASKLLICIDEGLFEKEVIMERIKNWVTAFRIKMNTKNISRTEIDFFAKFVITSNKEDKFIRIDDDSNRFWVTKVQQFTGEEIPDLLEQMKAEVPAFINYLVNDHKLKYPNKQRLWFHKSVYETEALSQLKDASKTSLQKELELLFEDIFLATSKDTLHITESNVLRLINQRLSKKIDASWLRSVLTKHMNLKTTKMSAYTPIDEFYTTNFSNIDYNKGYNVVLEKAQQRYYTFCIEKFLSSEELIEIGFDLESIKKMRINPLKVQGSSQVEITPKPVTTTNEAEEDVLPF